MSLDTIKLKNNTIIPALQLIGLYSESAVNLILGTIAQESLMGKYLDQIDGPAIGICQIEPPTFFDILHRRHPYLLKTKYHIASINPAMMHVDNSLSVIICRLKYLDASETLPDALDVIALASYWKRYYNTCEGSGCIEDFIKHYKEFIAPI